MLNTLVTISVLGVDWAWHVKFYLFSKFCLFASLLHLCKKTDETESVPHPNWLPTYMFAHRNLSWTVEQSGCILSVTIAGFPVLDSGDWQWIFACFCRLSTNHTYLTCRNFVCQHSVMTKTTVKRCACVFIVFELQHLIRCFFNANMWQNAITPRAGIPPDCDWLAEKLALLQLRLFPQRFSKHEMVCSGGVG